MRDGVPYAIDFMNPAPDMDINSLTPTYFDWAVKHMADMAIRLAKKPRRSRRATLQAGTQVVSDGADRRVDDAADADRRLPRPARPTELAADSQAQLDDQLQRAAGWSSATGRSAPCCGRGS